MKKNVRIISFAVAAFVALGGICLKQYIKAENYEMQLAATYSSALMTLNESLENISTELKKCRYFTDSEQLEIIARNLSVNSNAAKNAVAALPNQSSELANINKFLSQVGDYTSLVAKASVMGVNVGSEELDNIKNLSETADEIYQKLGQVTLIISENSNIIDSEVGVGIYDSIANADESLTDYPTLIYDGPFSDHILSGESQLLLDSEEYEKEYCRKIAAELLYVSVDEVADSGEQNGKIAGYRFMSGDTELLITRRGGYLAYLRKYAPAGNRTLDADQCINRAVDFIGKAYAGTFKESYYVTEDGMCLINFAYKEGNCICYTDLIKVGVSISTGDILFFEADGYIMNHEQRTVATPNFSEKEAADALSDLLIPERVQHVIIPSDGFNEIYCYEFLCKDDTSREVLMYINAATLKEERLFLVYKTPTGKFTK